MAGFTFCPRFFPIIPAQLQFSRSFNQLDAIQCLRPLFSLGDDSINVRLPCRVNAYAMVQGRICCIWSYVKGHSHVLTMKFSSFPNNNRLVA